MLETEIGKVQAVPDGEAHLEEAAARRAKAKASQVAMMETLYARYRQPFSLIDADGDGAITAAELHELFTSQVVAV